jgi:hypothetical protein
MCRPVRFVSASLPSELRVGRVLPTDAKDVAQKRGHRCPVFFVRHAKSANFLAYTFENAHFGQQPQGTCERRANPRMRVDRVEHAQR